jgi:hypothetical protein
MPDWRAKALEEIANLKPYWVERYGWRPEHETSDEAIDLFVRMRSRRLGDREFLLRLRYLSDWQSAGRRETFVNPDDRGEDGTTFWPPHSAVRAINPQHQPPAICLKGVWGYHSVLHAGERMDGATLLDFLIALQRVFNEVN